MEALSIFTPTGKFERIQLPCPASREHVPTDMSMLDIELCRSMKKLQSGTDYVTEYVDKEEKEVLQSAQYHTDNNHKLDEVSQGTVGLLSEITDTQLTKLYKTYNFAHRAKSNLTIASQKDNIISMVETNSVVIIQGPTGCGKTTQVPQYILDASYKKRLHCNIIVTQPRRIAAMSIAKRVCQERDWPTGTLVGYHVGLINHTSQDTRLTYCTTGVLLHKLINKKHMQDYTHIIIDEVHERDQDMDFLLLVVRKLWRMNSRNVKIILMSATFEVNKFAKYFSSPVANKLAPAPVVDIVKRNYFNKTIYYLCQIGTLGPLPEVCTHEPQASRKMMEFCVSIAVVLDELDMKADDSNYDEETGYFDRHVILIFLPGIHEIEELHNLLSLTKHEKRKWDILILHSSITNEEQQRIFMKPPRGFRRIVLSTNIAESSITLPDVKYVIDFCLTKQLVTDPNTNFQCLQLCWASKASCDQRAGRAGRVMDGRVYRLIPKKFYDTVLPAESTPEMLQAPLENVVLKTKLLDLGEPKALLALALDPPDLSNLERTILLLKEAGALYSHSDDFKIWDGDLTDLGRVMAQLPLDIRMSKLIVLGHVFSMLKDTIIMAASMSVKDVFNNPYQEKLLGYTLKLHWSNEESSDCIAFLNVYKVWMTEKASNRMGNNDIEQKWARRNCLQIKVLREVKALVTELTARLEQMGIVETAGVNKVVWEERERPFVLKFVIAGAFYPNYFVTQSNAISLNEQAAVKLLGGLEPYTTVYLQGWPLNQPGLLYAQRFQEAFKKCLTSSSNCYRNIKVMFDNSSRVCIQFSKNENITSKNVVRRKICLPVYKALKLKQVNTSIQIPVLKEKEAKIRAQELNLLKNDSEHFGISEMLTRSVVPTKCAKLRPQLPKLNESQILVFVRHVTDPGHFWVEKRGSEQHKMRESVKSRIDTCFDSFPKLTALPEVGSLVIAPHQTKLDLRMNVKIECDKNVKYMRAVVQNYSEESESLVVVLFIDYGGTSTVRVSDLRAVDPEDELVTFPALSYECVLANIRPSIAHSLSERWTRAAFDMFYAFINKPGKLYGEIYSIVNSVMALELIYESESDGVININDYLVENNFAIKKDEDYFSRHNHKLRSKQIEMTKEQCQYYEELQYGQDTVESYPDPPAISDCYSTVTLRGPFSPLETELIQMIEAGRGKRVRITPNSANSVLLDVRPEETYEHLVVAGSVSQSASGRNLTLYDTTLMPDIQGIIALSVLTFTPHMELRRNVFGTRYIGALCGLGYDSETDDYIFPDHDIQLKFDCEISMEDLTNINRLRYWMSVGIQCKSTPENHQSMENMINCQNKVKNTFLGLINKRRKSQKSEIVPNFDKWHLYDDNLFLSSGLAEMAKQNVYKLHAALALEERDENSDLKDHVMELREIANQDKLDGPEDQIDCNLCKATLFSIPELRTHLYTLAHRQKEENLGIQLY